MRYRAEIDGLRALAVIPVILYHAGFSAFSGGFVGVDVFFVISGYLITTIIYTELQTGAFSIAHFYERRARRILPALFLVLFASLPFAWFWLLPQDMKEFSESLVSVSTFTSNILFYKTSGYFATASELKPLIHTWSLAVEEQYYVLFPLFLMLTWKLGARWMIALLAVLGAISLAAAQWGSLTHPDFTFFLLPTRGWELLIGGFIAFYYAHHNIKHHNHSVEQLGSLIGILLIAYAVFAYTNQTPFPSLYALAPTLGAGLIIVFATHKTIVGRLLGSKPFVGIGLISYSAYLWHQPMFAFARQRSLTEPSMALMAGLAVSSLLLAYLSWRFVERPFRNKHRFSRKQVFTLGMFCSLVFICVGLAGYLTNGFESRLPAQVRDSFVFGDGDIFSGSRRSDESCPNLLGLPILSEEVCLSVTKSPKILFAGDSHAMALYSSIYAKKEKFDALLVSAHACPLYQNLTYTPTYKRSFDNNCTAISNEVLRVAKKYNSIKVVVLYNHYATIDNNKSRYYFNGKNVSNKEAFEYGYNYLISNLLQEGKKVVFVVDVPYLKYDPRECIERPYLANTKFDECAFSTDENKNIRLAYSNEVRKLKKLYPSLIVYDPTSLFCDANNCRIMIGGKSLYNDFHHISVFASTLLLDEMQRDALLRNL